MFIEYETLMRKQNINQKLNFRAFDNCHDIVSQNGDIFLLNIYYISSDCSTLFVLIAALIITANAAMLVVVTCIKRI